MTSLPPSDRCRRCGKVRSSTTELIKCSRCDGKQLEDMVPLYCSEECRRFDWRRRHRVECCCALPEWPHDASTCVFDEMEEPPQNFVPYLYWKDPYWAKFSDMVLRQQVLDVILEHFHVMPTCAKLCDGAPEFLTREEFTKFCFHAEKWVEENPPQNPNPHDHAKISYRNLIYNSMNYFYIFKYERHIVPRTIHIVPKTISVRRNGSGTNLQQRSILQWISASRESQTQLRETNKKQKTCHHQVASISELKATLLDLDEFTTSLVASYLYPWEWCNLKFTCRSNSEWPKPPPAKKFLNYSAVYFYISNRWDKTNHYIVSSIEDVLKVATVEAETMNAHLGCLCFGFSLLEFFTGENGSRIIPLVAYPTISRKDSWNEVTGELLYGDTPLLGSVKQYKSSHIMRLKSESKLKKINTKQGFVPTFEIWSMLKWFSSEKSENAAQCNIKYIHSMTTKRTERLGEDESSGKGFDMAQVWYNPRMKISGVSSNYQNEANGVPEFVRLESTSLGSYDQSSESVDSN